MDAEQPVAGMSPRRHPAEREQRRQETRETLDKRRCSDRLLGDDILEESDELLELLAPGDFDRVVPALGHADGDLGLAPGQALVGFVEEGLERHANGSDAGEVGLVFGVVQLSLFHWCQPSSPLR